MIRIVLIAVVVVTVVSIGVSVLITSMGRLPSTASRDFFAVPQDYPTESGQEMQPLWGDTQEASDGPAN